MVETLLVGGIVGIILVILIAVLLLQAQRRSVTQLQTQQKAWERAQEARQQYWVERQEQHITETAAKLTTQVEQLRHAWQEWEERDAERARQLAQQYEAAHAQLRIEYELARLPRIEDVPLPINGQTQPPQNHGKPPSFQKADLSGRDLSHRCLAQADLSGASLAHANLFMADLSGASLAESDLSYADLSAANLTGADLHGATLIGTNLLVSDLKQTLLASTDLRHVHNLTWQQLKEALLDETSQLDTTMAQALHALTPRPSTLSSKPGVSGTGLGTTTSPANGLREKPETPLPPTPDTPLPSDPETPLPEARIEHTQTPS